MRGFTSLDYTVLAAYLFVTALFGVLVGRGQGNVQDYFLAGKKLPWWAICFSIVATETSTLTFIGVPSLSYVGNMTFLQVGMGYLLGRILVSLWLIPAYFKDEIYTAYDLLNSRFGPHVRNVAALLFQVTRVLADGVRLYATVLVLSLVLPISDLWGLVIIAAVTLTYTLCGGLRAVVWNDTVQLALYLTGALLAFWTLLERMPGGWPAGARLAIEGGKFQILDFSLNIQVTYTFWAGIIGGACLTLATHGTDQMMVQRYLACGSKRGSQIAVITSGIVVLAQFLLFSLVGILLFIFYFEVPRIESIPVDQIFPLFVVEELPSGISGLVIAAVFASAMSTLSSSLNSLSSSWTNDFYRNYSSTTATSSQYLMVSRLSTAGWAVILVGVSLLARNWGEVLEAGLTITSISMGAILGIFLLGIWTRRTGPNAALVSLVAGITVPLTLHLSGIVAWTWYVLVGTATTLTIGLLWDNGFEKGTRAP